MLSKVGESVFFVVTKSSGKNCASLGMCVHSFSFSLEICCVKPDKRKMFSQGDVDENDRSQSRHRRMVSAWFRSQTLCHPSSDVSVKGKGGNYDDEEDEGYC